MSSWTHFVLVCFALCFFLMIRRPPGSPRTVPLCPTRRSSALAGARPFGDHGIGRLGHMALEPAIEPDAVVVGRYPELADLVGAHATARASASKLCSHKIGRAHV